ncbi:predicted protein [Streptomyces iranensis]|uniref:Uncharacterized protein n=1 Tax=Streptomyces iranensis TaxID=576784 RepID=A0A061A6R6_9ACTN|nr:predicted protein [Streptomyces iranensis]
MEYVSSTAFGRALSKECARPGTFLLPAFQWACLRDFMEFLQGVFIAY